MMPDVRAPHQMVRQETHMPLIAIDCHWGCGFSQGECNMNFPASQVQMPDAMAMLPDIRSPHVLIPVCHLRDGESLRRTETQNSIGHKRLPSGFPAPLAMIKSVDSTNIM